eukprot:scaffold323_cov188-Alexandrium_tamarense.AAC.6
MVHCSPLPKPRTDGRPIGYCGRLRQRPLSLPTLLLAAVATSSTLMNTPTLQSQIIFAEAKVHWTGNENVKPEHRAAHEAPRSQRYWDENNIKRPEYAKTDAEIAAELRQRKGKGGASNGGSLKTWIINAIFASMILGLIAITYANVTGDWETLRNNPIRAFVELCISKLNSGGISGQRLGTGATETHGASEEEQRLARLARFDNPKDVAAVSSALLDNMKED